MYAGARTPVRYSCAQSQSHDGVRTAVPFACSGGLRRDAPIHAIAYSRTRSVQPGVPPRSFIRPQGTLTLGTLEPHTGTTHTGMRAQAARSDAPIDTVPKPHCSSAAGTAAGAHAGRGRRADGRHGRLYYSRVPAHGRTGGRRGRLYYSRVPARVCRAVRAPTRATPRA
jgi:hypothetical protein